MSANNSDENEDTRQMKSGLRADQLYVVDHNQAKTLVKRWLGVRPVVLLGPTGIGKTEILKEAATELEYGFEVLYPAGWEPTDFKGFGYTYGQDGNRHSGWAAHEKFFVDRPRETILAIDEITNAMHSTQSELLEMFREHKINDVPLPKNVHLIGAGNLTEDSAAANDLIEPLSERCSIYYLKTPSQYEYVDWMRKKQWNDESVFAYLLFNPAMIHRQRAGDRVFPCPRSWTDAVRALDKCSSLNLKVADKVEIVAGAVGSGAAMEYKVFAQLSDEIPKWEDVLSGKVKLDTDKKWLYLMLTSVSLNATKTHAPNVLKLMERLDREYIVLFCRILSANRPVADELMKSPKYMQLVRDLRLPK